MSPFFSCSLGLLLLLIGGELLVRGASRLARSLGISPLVVGLTVVAFGTSAPELAVSLRSALNGMSDLAVGNVVGSNVFNVLFILGVSALVTPLVVSKLLVRLDVPFMIVVSVLLAVLAGGGRIGRLEGSFLFFAGVGYTVFLFVQARAGKTTSEESPAESGGGSSRWGSLLLILAGLLLLVVGSDWLIDSAVAVARALGVGELVIGLTLVAAGTSLPEVATSVLASVRGERDIAVGNVVGSNIFNILWVLGLSAAISPTGLSVSAAARNFDIPVMIAVAFACLPIFFTGYRISRPEGLTFCLYYLAYTTYLYLASSQHQSLPAYSAAMGLFVLPLTLLTLLVLTYRAVSASRRG